VKNMNPTKRKPYASLILCCKRNTQIESGAFTMFGNGARTIFLFGVSSWFRRSVRSRTLNLLCEPPVKNPAPAPPAAGFFLRCSDQELDRSPRLHQ
jgi:hypothetical protein